jgi:hypothetical protein
MPKTAMRTAGLFVAAAGFLALSTADAASDPASVQGTAVVVELFSSEGCSSCPPADTALRELDRDQPVTGVTVIALEEHVDYWNDLGWTDPFSQARFSARQRDYAAALPDRSVYTPELVIDGHATAVGGDRLLATQAIQAAAREAKARVALERRADQLAIVVRDLPAGLTDDPAEIWLAVTESDLSTRVERGENAGRLLAHGPIVRALRKLGSANANGFRMLTPLDLDAGWRTSGLRAVVFVQRARSKRIVGGASQPL